MSTITRDCSLVKKIWQICIKAKINTSNLKNYINKDYKKEKRFFKYLLSQLPEWTEINLRKIGILCV